MSASIRAKVRRAKVMLHIIGYFLTLLDQYLNGWKKKNHEPRKGSQWIYK
ncbi:MAG: hypothetical protein WCD47_18710 [Candidatus Sulfotelmatobacter sp.]